jgi:hypothetical protein
MSVLEIQTSSGESLLGACFDRFGQSWAIAFDKYAKIDPCFFNCFIIRQTCQSQAKVLGLGWEPWSNSYYSNAALEKHGFHFLRSNMALMLKVVVYTCVGVTLSSLPIS